jgi:transcriptional regulator of arginine metabolism
VSREAREQAILEIVEETVVRNQKELVLLLAARGIAVGQATVSRDIKRLGLVKRPARRGGYRYSAPGGPAPTPPRTRRHLRIACEQFVTRIGPGEALLVLKTLTGRANAVAVALDECGLDGVVGTLAGDDTILVVASDQAARGRLQEELSAMVAGSGG